MSGTNCSWALADVLLLAASRYKDTFNAGTNITGDRINRYGLNSNVRAEAVNFVRGDSAYVGTGYYGSARPQDFSAHNAAISSWY